MFFHKAYPNIIFRKQTRISRVCYFMHEIKNKEVKQHYVAGCCGQFFRVGVKVMSRLTKEQRDRLIGTLLSILASVVFAVAENIMSDDKEEENE